MHCTFHLPWTVQMQIFIPPRPTQLVVGGWYSILDSPCPSGGGGVVCRQNGFRTFLPRSPKGLRGIVVHSHMCNSFWILFKFGTHILHAKTLDEFDYGRKNLNLHSHNGPLQDLGSLIMGRTIVNTLTCAILFRSISNLVHTFSMAIPWMSFIMAEKSEFGSS